mgnify:CR=1 FL=1
MCTYTAAEITQTAEQIAFGDSRRSEHAVVAFDHIVTVEAPVCMRLDRMVEERGMSLEQAEARIRHQSSEEERRAIADIVIDSTHPLPEMLAQVGEIYAGWCAGR